MKPALFLLALAALGSPASASPVQRFVSPATQVTLLELYTSEGCSSCPPAERWLGTMRDAPGLWTTFVPIAFHVDYWNRLGWPDKFSQRGFTQREYAYAAAWRTSSVYTPCVVRDGTESRAGEAAAPVPRPAGILAVAYDGAAVRTEFTPVEKSAGVNWEVHAALLGSDITSKVTAGENRGSTLRHEFVALALVHGDLDTPLPLARITVDGVRRYALAVWVTRPGALAPVQAVGGWLTPPDRAVGASAD
jgi:hypothetical protein